MVRIGFGGPRSPRMRTYTPRRIDGEAGELDIDFVLHGDGPASQWAGRAEIGDKFVMMGPAPGYAVDREAACRPTDPLNVLCRKPLDEVPTVGPDDPVELKQNGIVVVRVRQHQPALEFGVQVVGGIAWRLGLGPPSASAALCNSSRPRVSGSGAGREGVASATAFGRAADNALVASSAKSNG